MITAVMSFLHLWSTYNECLLAKDGSFTLIRNVYGYILKYVPKWRISQL